MPTLLDPRGEPISVNGKRGKASPKTGALAWPGGAMAAGIPTDEYNVELRGRAGLQIYEKMRRTSAQVRSTLMAAWLPLRSTKWWVEEPDGGGAAEKEATELLNANLFSGMETSFDELLQMAGDGAYQGYSIPEIVWEENEGRIEAGEIADRNPELIERWLQDEDGRVVGYLYVGARPSGNGITEQPRSTLKTERIPVPLKEHTLHFCYDRRYGNPTGRGLGRTMYPYWYYQQSLMKILAVGSEKNLMSIPIGEITQDFTGQEDDALKFLQDLSFLRAGESAAMVLRPGQKVTWLDGKSTVMDAMEFLHYQDTQIAKVYLAGFMNLGTQQVGTQAVGTVQAQMFLEGCDAHARWFEQTVTRDYLRYWVAYNYGPGVKVPFLTHRKIQSKSMEAIAGMLKTLTDGGFVTPTEQDETYLRDVAELPQIDPDNLLTRRAEAKAERSEERKSRMSRGNTQEERNGQGERE